MKKILTVMFLFSLFSLHCKKESDSSAFKDTSTFPNNIGNALTYLRYDSSIMKEDTVDVQITGERLLSDGESAKIWLFTPNKYSGSEVDTNYVTSDADTIKEYDAFNEVPAYSNKYIFPFAVGKSWTNYNFFDITTIVSLDEVTVPAGTFKNCFHLVRDVNGPGSLSRNEYWFEPNIGIIKMIIGERALQQTPIETETFQLLSYTLK